MLYCCLAVRHNTEGRISVNTAVSLCAAQFVLEEQQRCSTFRNSEGFWFPRAEMSTFLAPIKQRRSATSTANVRITLHCRAFACYCHGKAKVLHILSVCLSNKLMTFERKIMRKINGPARTAHGYWRITTNQEINDIIKRTKYNWVY